MTKDIVLTASERIFLRQFSYQHGRVMDSTRLTVAKMLKLGLIYESREYVRKYKVYKVTDGGKAWLEKSDAAAIRALPTARKPRVQEAL